MDSLEQAYCDSISVHKQRRVLFNYLIYYSGYPQRGLDLLPCDYWIGWFRLVRKNMRVRYGDLRHITRYSYFLKELSEGRPATFTA
jgi:hypothetical protein